jgi:preprotein translocase subunit SecF
MQIFKDTLNIDFMGKRKLAMGLSILLLALALGSLFSRGLNLGLDFSGGTLIEVGYAQPVEVADVRKVLVETGYGDAVVQHFGSSRDVRIRINQRADESSAQISDHILLGLKKQDESVQMRRVEFVGPQIGDELREDGGLAMLYALFGIMIYVALRFEYRFAIGSVTALFHDVLITLGIFSIFQLEFDLTVLAALLAVIGYSLNDTIVVYDRIRENFRRVRKTETLDILNISLNQTLSRTIMTSFTTLLVLLALFFFGGEMIHGFATALLVGVVVGTYSSIYVASVMALVLGVSREDLLPVEKEGAEIDDMP